MENLPQVKNEEQSDQRQQEDDSQVFNLERQLQIAFEKLDRETRENARNLDHANALQHKLSVTEGLLRDITSKFEVTQERLAATSQNEQILSKVLKDTESELSKTKQDFKNAMEEKESELKKALQRIREVLEENSQKSQEYEKLYLEKLILNDEISKSQVQLTVTKREVESLKELNKTIGEQASIYREELSKRDASIAEMQREMSILDDDLRRHKEAMNEHQNKHLVNIQKAVDYRAEIDNLMIENNQLRTELHQGERREESKTAANNEALHSRDALGRVSEDNNRLRLQVSALQKQYDSLQQVVLMNSLVDSDQVRQQEEGFMKILENTREIPIKIQALMNEKKEVAEQLENAMKKNYEQRIFIEKLKKQLDIEEDNKKRAEEEARQYKFQYQAFAKKSNSLTQQSHKLRVLFQTIDKLPNKEEIIGKYKEETEESHLEDHEMAFQEEVKLQEQLFEKEHQVKEKDNAIAELVEEIEAFRLQIDTYKKENNQLKLKLHDQAFKGQLPQQLSINQSHSSGISFEEHQSQMDKQADIQRELRREIKELEYCKVTLENENVNLRLTCDKAQDKLTNANEKLTTLQQTLLDLQSQQLSSKSEISSMKKEFDLEKGRADLLQMTLQFERTQKASLTNEVQDLKSSLEALKKENLSLLQQENKPIQLAESKNKEMYDYIAKLQAEKGEKESELISKEQERLQLEIRINDIQMECESLAKKAQLERQAREELQKIIHKNAEMIAKRGGEAVKADEDLEEIQGDQRVRDKSAVERENEELKRLVISQNDTNQEELKSRDEVIEKLTTMLQMQGEKAAEQLAFFSEQINMKNNLINKEASGFEASMKDAQEHISQLTLEREALREELHALAAAYEKLKVTDQMQQEEITRLNEQFAGIDQNSQVVSKSNVVSLTLKVQKMHLNYLEKERELQVSLAERETLEENYKAVIATLEEERDNLKASYKMVKTEAETFRTQLMSQRQSDETLGGAGASTLSMDDTLVMLERITHAESEQERLKAKCDQLANDNHKLRQERQSEKTERIRVEEVLSQYKASMHLKEVKLAQFDHMEEENKRYAERVEQLAKELSLQESKIAQVLEESKQQEAKALSNEIREQLVTLGTEFEHLRLQNTELSKELQRARGAGVPAPAEQEKEMFRKLYQTVKKAKDILIAIFRHVEMQNPIFEEAGSKRARME
ncbi:hypothetical protein FGO68_gene5958 [Halteria grandinella]|uniref:Uncharacterized protein n=1 Tax=Halteria grandinella TaxID=5974 RepID=A0A8J8P4D7_HALGN|nr:hypothetical protein FGO68_gene5958 [Halteria grandinella]